MKAKNIFAVVMVMAILIVPTMAMAAPSPTLGSKPPAEVTHGDLTLKMLDNPGLGNVSIKDLTSEQASAVLAAVNQYLGSASGTVLTTFNMSFSGSGPVTVQVAGVSPSDTIIIVHMKDDGTVEIYQGTVLDHAGRIQFWPNGNSPFAIVRVNSGTPAGITSTGMAAGVSYGSPAIVFPFGTYLLPQTGEANNTLPMAALVLVSLAVLGLGVVTLKRNNA